MELGIGGLCVVMEERVSDLSGDPSFSHTSLSLSPLLSSAERDRPQAAVPRPTAATPSL